MGVEGRKRGLISNKEIIRKHNEGASMKTLVLESGLSEIKVKSIIKNDHELRKIEIPVVYAADTGQWLIVCGLKYDNEEIVSVEAWDGDGVMTYKKGTFVVDEQNIGPLYQDSVEF